MKRYQKQLLIYFFLIVTAIVFLYLDFHFPYLFQVINDKTSSALGKPRASIFAALLSNFMIGNRNPQSYNIFLLIIAILAPIWMSSGYYFARKLDLPGVKSDTLISSKKFYFVASFCIVWGIILPLILRSNDINIKEIYEHLFLLFSVVIIYELFVRLFLLSVISWILNLGLHTSLNRGKILMLSSILSVLVTLLFTKSMNSGFIASPVVNIVIAIIGNLLLNWVFILRGVLTTIILRIIILILNYVIVLKLIF